VYRTCFDRFASGAGSPRAVGDGRGFAAGITEQARVDGAGWLADDARRPKKPARSANMRRRCRLGRFALIVSCSALAACSAQSDSEEAITSAANASDVSPGSPAGHGGRALELRTLSNRADLISGGDAFVEVVLPRHGQTRHLHVRVGDRDVSSAFARRADGRTTGVITGLADGPSTIVAEASGVRGAALTVTNHPIGGPVISGAQIQPLVCATPVAIPQNGDTPGSNASGLSTPAIDAQCNIATEIKLYYRTTAPDCASVLPDPNPPTPPPANGCFKPFDPAAPPPADLAMTTTDANVTVPYIVRVERGTLNRGIYDIAVLFDPSRDDPATGWKPTAPQPGWNGKLLYSFGASTGQPRRQFRSEQTWTDDVALSRGFMVAINSMTDSLYNSNRVAMVETLMMTKEHIGDTYGEIRYTIGNGCSGGSINQLTAASIYPGLLDGIQPTCTYPDSESTGIEVADCELLVRLYVKPEWAALMGGLSQEQINAKKAAINGHRDQTGCHAWFNSFAAVGRPGNFIPDAVLDNTTGAIGPVPGAGVRNNCQLPPSMVYDPVTNPGGLRCSGQDHAVAIWGTVDGTSRARSTRDNVGIQYGLAALVSGAITPDEFVVLNEKIGGADADLNMSPARSAADAEALPIAYAAGIVSDGAQLAKTPIIDLRGWDDSNIPPPPGLGIHHIWRSFSLRARLDEDSGNHDNHVMWRYGTGLIAPAASGLSLQSFLMMDQWVAAIRGDDSCATIEEKIARHKPHSAFDFCYLSTDTTFSTKVTDPAVCDADPLLARHASPRQVAGGPLAENILKCQLRPLDPADYSPSVLTPEQIDRLRAVFPDGVCDWSAPGVGQEPAISPLDFTGGPGGVPLPSPPRSRPR
jgi:hypothetical protein